MAVAFESITINTDSSGRSSASFSHTNTSGDTLAIITHNQENFGSLVTCTAASYNSVALTERVAGTREVGPLDFAAKIWTLDGPATGANTVSVTYDGTGVNDAIMVLSFTGANNGVGSTTGTANGDSANPSVTFGTDNSTGLIISGAMLLGNDGIPWTPGTGVTERADNATGGSNVTDHAFTAGDKAATGGSDTIDFTGSTSDDWLITAIELNAAAVAGVKLQRPLRGVGI